MSVTSVLTILERRAGTFGGAELATRLFLQGLARKGFRVTVLSGFPREELAVPKAVDVRYTPFLDVSSKPVLWLNLTRLGRTLEKMIHKCDVVYIPRISYQAIPIAKRLGRKVVVHLHDYQPIAYSAYVFAGVREDGRRIGTDIFDAIRYEILEGRGIGRALVAGAGAPLNRMNSSLLEDADEIICVSRRHLEILRKALPSLRSRMTQVCNPLPDVPAMEKDPSARAFLYLGRDSWAKGFEVFLEASAGLLRRGLPARFLVAGSLRSRTERILAAINRTSPGAYQGLGWLDHDALMTLHRTCRGLIFPSIWEEPLPYAVTEAMLAGTVPIASRVGGVPEIVAGTSAEKMLFDPGDIEGCTEAMETVLSMPPEILSHVSQELRTVTASRFSYEATIEAISKSFES